jgi:hypothetical protein
MSFRIQEDVYEHSNETRSRRLVLLALADRANDAGVSWPSVANLAHRTRLSRSQVQRCLRQLEADGAITVQPGGGRRRPNRYTVIVSAHARGTGETAAACGRFSTTERAASEPKGPHSGRKRAAPMRPESSGTFIEPSEGEPVGVRRPLPRSGKKPQTGVDRRPRQGRSDGRTLIDLWNATVTPSGSEAVRPVSTTVCVALPTAAATPDRLRTAAARLREEPDLEKWRTGFRKVAASPFCRGQNERGWRATLDFVLKPGCLIKVLEGAYDDAREARSAAIFAELRAREAEKRAARS